MAPSKEQALPPRDLPVDNGRPAILPPNEPPVIRDASGTYVPTFPLGQGAFGTVWSARHKSASGIDREVAIKVLHNGAEPQHLARLRDEARILTLLDHPVFVRVHDLVRVDSGWAMVMERVHGVDLRGLLTRGPFLPSAAAGVVARLSGALDTAWDHRTPDGRYLRLAHRDLKPANVMIGLHGDVRLLDFGVAWVNLAEREAATVDVTVGSIGYMAPERLRGTDHPKSDVYSLGVVWWEMLSAKRYRRMSELSEDHEKHRARALGQVEAPPLLRSMLQYDPETRPDMAEVAHAAVQLVGSSNVERFLRQRVAEARQEPDAVATEAERPKAMRVPEATAARPGDADTAVPRLPPAARPRRVAPPSPGPAPSRGRAVVATGLVFACAVFVAFVAVGSRPPPARVPVVAGATLASSVASGSPPAQDFVVAPQPVPVTVEPSRLAPPKPPAPSVPDAPVAVAPQVVPPPAVASSPTLPSPEPGLVALGWVRLEGADRAVLQDDDGTTFALPGVVPPGTYALVVGGQEQGAAVVDGGAVVDIVCNAGRCAQR